MKAVGIVLAGGKRSGLGVLSDKRNLAAIPVGGCYRAIDFSLSNMSNSGIKKVAVIAQHNTRSLMDHLSSSKWWDFGRKSAGLFLLTPHMFNAETFNFKGTADAMYQNIGFLKKSNDPYVVIVSGEQIMHIDFNQLIKYHEQKGADITICCKEMEHTQLQEYGVVGLDENNQIIDFEEKPLEPQFSTASLGIYVIGREMLIHLLTELEKEGRYDFVNDLIIRYRRKLKIYGYLFEGYWKTIKNTKSFYDVNMDFLKPETRNLFFNTFPYIATKAKDEPPAKFNETAKVVNSIISSGDIISGTVENSVLFRKVFVAEDAVIRNAVVLEGATISKGAIVENAILDKGVYISEGKHIKGNEKESLIIAKGSII
jgi:glucose-1-phosphate adenylyltransferase